MVDLSPEQMEKQRLASARYRERHPDRWAETSKRSKEKHADRIRERDAAAHRAKRAEVAISEGRPPGVAGIARRFTDEERRQRLNAATKAWRDKNPERQKAANKSWEARHPGAKQAHKLSRRGRERGAGGKVSAADIARLRVLQRGNCSWCLKPLGKATPDVDHYKPLMLGGTSDPSNLRLMHRKCNRAKGFKDPLQHGMQHGMLCW